MTKKRAKKLLMAAGFDRNSANFALELAKKSGIPENRRAKTFIIGLVIHHLDEFAVKHKFSPYELGLHTIKRKGDSLVYEIYHWRYAPND